MFFFGARPTLLFVIYHSVASEAWVNTCSSRQVLSTVCLVTFSIITDQLHLIDSDIQYFQLWAADVLQGVSEAVISANIYSFLSTADAYQMILVLYIFGCGTLKCHWLFSQDNLTLKNVIEINTFFLFFFHCTPIALLTSCIESFALVVL